MIYGPLMYKMTWQELADELTYSCPDWQTRYTSFKQACYTHHLGTEFEEFLLTEEGKQYQTIAEAHDHEADNRIRRAYNEAEDNWLAKNLNWSGADSRSPAGGDIQEAEDE